MALDRRGRREGVTEPKMRRSCSSAPVARRWPAVLAVALLAGLPLLAAAQPCPVAKACPTIAVLDFALMDRCLEERDPCTRELNYEQKPYETGKHIRGWWTSAQNVYYNANIGRQAADIVTREIQAQGVAKTVSRQQIRYYMQDKRDLLQSKLDLDEKQSYLALLKLDPVQVGRELGADKVVVGRICDAELRNSRFSTYFASAATFEVAVIDVRSGQVEWNESYGGWRGHQSLYGAFEHYGRQVVEDIARGPAYE